MKLLSTIGRGPITRFGVLVGLLLAGICVHETSAQSVEVLIPSIEGSVGEEVTIPIEVGDLTGLGVVAFSIRIGYDPGVLDDEFSYDLEGTIGDGNSAFATTFQGDGAFTVAYARNAAYPISGSGTLINLVTSVGGEGSIPIEFLYLNLEQADGTDIETTMQAGSFTTVGTITSTENDGIPDRFELSGNYPNPFNPSTTVRFDLPETAEIRLQVYDLLGRNVLSVPPVMVEAGADRVLRVDAGDLPSGTYVYRLAARTASDLKTQSGRMTLVK